MTRTFPLSTFAEGEASRLSRPVRGACAAAAERVASAAGCVNCTAAVLAMPLTVDGYVLIANYTTRVDLSIDGVLSFERTQV